MCAANIASQCLCLQVDEPITRIRRGQVVARLQRYEDDYNGHNGYGRGGGRFGQPGEHSDGFRGRGRGRGRGRYDGYRGYEDGAHYGGEQGGVEVGLAASEQPHRYGARPHRYEQPQSAVGLAFSAPPPPYSPELGDAGLSANGRGALRGAPTGVASGRGRGQATFRGRELNPANARNQPGSDDQPPGFEAAVPEETTGKRRFLAGRAAAAPNAVDAPAAASTMVPVAGAAKFKFQGFNAGAKDFQPGPGARSNTASPVPGADGKQSASQPPRMEAATVRDLAHRMSAMRVQQPAPQYAQSHEGGAPLRSYAAGAVTQDHCELSSSLCFRVQFYLHRSVHESLGGRTCALDVAGRALILLSARRPVHAIPANASGYVHGAWPALHGRRASCSALCHAAARTWSGAAIHLRQLARAASVCNAVKCSHAVLSARLRQAKTRQGTIPNKKGRNSCLPRCPRRRPDRSACCRAGIERARGICVEAAHSRRASSSVVRRKCGTRPRKIAVQLCRHATMPANCTAAIEALAVVVLEVQEVVPAQLDT